MATSVALPPPPIPVTTDTGLITAISTVVKYITRLATGFTPKGPQTLDVADYYHSLTHASRPNHLALICERLSLYCASEAAWQKSPTRETLNNFGDGFRSMSEKYMAACAAHLEAQEKKKTTATSSSVISPTALAKLSLAYEYSHTEAERVMLNLHGGRLTATEQLLQSTRKYWSICITQLPLISSSQQSQAIPTLKKLIEDILTIQCCAQLLSHASGIGLWNQLAIQLLQEELQFCCDAQPRDSALHRIRLVKLLQTAAGTQKERETWRKELKQLPLPVAKLTNDTCLSPYTEFLSMVEYSFIGQQFTDSFTHIRDGLTNAKLRATAVLLQSKQLAIKIIPATETEKLQQLNEQYSMEQHRIMGTFEFASALLSQYAHDDYKCCLDHCRHAMAHFNKLLPSAPSQSLATPLQRFTTIQNRMRLFYIWSVQAELRGSHVEAKYICTKAMEDGEAQFYAQLHNGISQPIEPTTAASCSSSPSPPTPSPSISPLSLLYTGIVSGQLYLARLCAKLDLFPAVKDILNTCGFEPETPSTDLQQSIEAMASFTAANGIHLQQIRTWQTKLSSSESKSDDMDALTAKLGALKTEEASSTCATCSLFHSSDSTIAFTPCHLDALMHTLMLKPPITTEPPAATAPKPKGRAAAKSKTAATSKKGVEKEIAELESILEAHIAIRHPPLMRLIHHRLARLYGSSNINSVFHLHQALSITGRNEQLTFLPASDPRLVAKPYQEELNIFQNEFLQQLPSDWTVVTIDEDITRGELLLSRSTNKIQEFQTTPSTNLSKLSTSLKLALAEADEASKLAGQYNADRAMRKAVPAPTTKLKVKEKIDTVPSKAIKSKIETMRHDANVSIGSICEGLQNLLGDTVQLLQQGDGPLILILGSTLTHLPWENMPYLSPQRDQHKGDELGIIRERCVYRMNSWTFIRMQLMDELTLPDPHSLKQGYYVLNPQGNVNATEEFVKPCTELGWKGTVGAAGVNTNDWLAALQRPGYFFYAGHNGGEELVNPRDIQKLLKQSNPPPSSPSSTTTSSSSYPLSRVSSVAFQIGCSSALQRYKEVGSRPLYESEGLSLVYNQTGCPSMFGCIWNVPEDVDRWMMACLDHMKKEASSGKEPITILQCAIKARSACNQRFLTAASVVCYGLPVMLHS